MTQITPRVTNAGSSQFDEILQDLYQHQMIVDQADDVERLQTTATGANRRAMAHVELMRDAIRKHSLALVFAPQHTDRRGLAWWESYFSNWVEGVQGPHDFMADGALRGRYHDVADHHVAQIHDVRQVYIHIRNQLRRPTTPASWREFDAMLRDTHRHCFRHRDWMKPGEYKDVENRVGSYKGLGGRRMVPPEQVLATLRAGWSMAMTLPAGSSRAAVLEYLIIETHPFRDGNGRVSRLVGNGELTAAREQRLVIAPHWWDRYLTGLQAIHTDNDPKVWLQTWQQVRTVAQRCNWCHRKRLVPEVGEDGQWFWYREPTQRQQEYMIRQRIRARARQRCAMENSRLETVQP